MKSIHITQVSERDKKHWKTTISRNHHVYLYPDFSVPFTNMKDAQVFIKQTNDFLTSKLFEMNEIFVEAFALYRRQWFYLEDLGQVRIIRHYMEEIHQGFDLMIHKSNIDGYSYLVFSWFKIISRDMLAIIEILSSSYQRHNHWTGIKIIEVLKNRINNLVNEIFSYGRD